MCVLFLSLCKKTRSEIRNASLKSMTAQRKAEHVDWKNKLINSHTLRTNLVRKEYSIEETYDAGENSGESKKESSG